MSAPDPKPRLLGALVATLVSAAVVGDQLRLAFLARRAEVSHLLAVPPLAVWLAAAGLVLVALAVAIVGARRNPRLARVPLLLCVVILFVDAMILEPVRPLAGQDDGAYAIRAFSQELLDEAQARGRLPQSGEELDPALGDLGQPPYLVRGEPLPTWTAVVRRDCQGPALEVKGLRPGTFLYCLAPDAGRAWVSAVGRSSSTFGPPELLAHGGRPLSAELRAPQAGKP